MPPEEKPEHTEEPVADTVTHPETTNPAPESTPPPVASHADLHSTVAGLIDRVDGMEALLTKVVSVKPDSTPDKGPWTHRKFGRRD